MEQIVCVHCYDFFTSSPRHKNQCYWHEAGMPSGQKGGLEASQDEHGPKI